MYALSARSKANLEGVDDRLVAVVERAINETPIDFGVICGLRTEEEQAALFAKGASQIKQGGPHVRGRAVDLMAYIDGRGCWELKVYDDIADVMRAAAIAEDVPIRWGCCWHIRDIRSHEGAMEDAMNEYIDLRRSEGRRPFLDGPHFEVSG